MISHPVRQNLLFGRTVLRASMPAIPRATRARPQRRAVALEYSTWRQGAPGDDNLSGPRPGSSYTHMAHEQGKTPTQLRRYKSSGVAEGGSEDFPREKGLESKNGNKISSLASSSVVRGGRMSGAGGARRRTGRRSLSNQSCPPPRPSIRHLLSHPCCFIVFPGGRGVPPPAFNHP